MEWPQRPGFHGIIVGVGQIRLALILNQYSAANQLLHHALDDSLQHFPHLLVARGSNLDELWFALGIYPVDTVQHQTMQMDI
jgi:hypothetical protein